MRPWMLYVLAGISFVVGAISLAIPILVGGFLLGVWFLWWASVLRRRSADRSQG